MVHLSLAGVSDDGTRLLLVSDAGVEFTLGVDARLRAALRGDHARLGQLEIDMESTIRPREIQSRIRAGETAESVAQAAHTTVDKILPYANPVLAERAHMAVRAQRSSLRRASGEAGAGGARTLGDAVGVAMRAQNLDPETLEWDAWRREDGRWVLVAVHEQGGRTRQGHFTFDPPGNYVTINDADAAWLIGDAPIRSQSSARRPSDDLQRARQRRLGAAPADPGEQLPLGEDAMELVSDAPVGIEDAEPEETAEILHVAPRSAEPSAADEGALAPPPAPPLAPSPDPVTEPIVDPAADLGTDAGTDAGTQPVAEEPEEAPLEQPRRPKRKGRASVPSWDEIMFGSGDRD